MKCDKRIGKKACGMPADVFVLGQWRCQLHVPTGETNCSHSLAPSGRCAVCGAPTPK